MTGLKRYLMVALLIVASSARAEVFSLPTLETAQTDAVFQSLAASFAFRPLEPASDLGAVWGGAVGLAANLVDASALTDIFGGLDSTYLPNGDLQVIVGLPKGITLESGFIPKITYDGSALSKLAFAGKWTLNRTVLKKFPLSVAARISYTKASLGYTQAVTGGTVAVDYATSILGGNVTVSKYLGFRMLGLEPFAGVGLLTQSSSLGATGTGNLFGTSFPAGTASTSGSGTSLWFQAGLMLKLTVLGITAEYDNLFGMSSYALKLSVRF